MGRPRKLETAKLPEPVREQVKTMSGFNSEEEMLSSLPESTITALPTDEAPRRRRRTKAEMEALRAGEGSAPDPLLSDRRYQRAVGKGTFYGAPRIVKSGFSLAATIAKQDKIRLDDAETEDVEDFFYAVSKRHPFGDPFATWYGCLFLFLALMGALVGKRFAEAKGESFQKSLAKFFGYGGDASEDKTEVENDEEN